VQAEERSRRQKLGCPEEVAYRMGFISSAQLLELAASTPNPEYRGYLLTVAALR
jgi:hypothetical protein